MIQHTIYTEFLLLRTVVHDLNWHPLGLYTVSADPTELREVTHQVKQDVRIPPSDQSLMQPRRDLVVQIQEWPQ